MVGTDAGDVEAALIAGLVARGASPVAILADDPALPRAARPDVVAVRGCGEAGASWKSLGAAGVVLSAAADCAREAIAAAGPLKLRFAAGLEPDALPLPPGSLVATGRAPFAPTPPTPPAVHDGAPLDRSRALPQAPALGAWQNGHPSPPTWWASLGHDAAVLAWAGVQVLPAQGTEDPREVEARRALAASALAGAQAELWTTEAHGFGGARTLPRTLGVREVAAPSRP